MPKRDPIAEVVSSTITGFIAQCSSTESDDGVPRITKPRFGSFLKVECKESKYDTLAVVYNVITGSPDNAHQPWALGMSREQLRQEQPHIFSLLRTEVHAVVVGYASGKEVFQHLPPLPADVHDFVYEATNDEVRLLTKDLEFLRLLSSVTVVPQDELIAACIREAYYARGREHAFLVEAGQALSHMMRSDYDRLVSILKQIRPEAIARA
ncbi:MAG TPA: hypothetical protein V6D17_06460 [Candidatus Obscuribacterales bacterium]